MPAPTSAAAPTATRRPCPVCGASRVRRWFREDGASIGRCRECGTLYTFEPCTPSPATYFKEEYFQGDEHLASTFGSYRADAFRQFGAVLAAAKPNGGRILDIGCAAGDFLATLDGQSWNRLGLEPSTMAVQKARARGLEVVEGIFGSTPLPVDRFDAISVLDTLPCVEDPRLLLRTVVSMLADDGVALVEIPGFTFRLLKNTGPVSYLRSRSWSHLNPRDFVFFPSKRSLRRLFDDSGLELVEIRDVAPNRYGSARTQAAFDAYARIAKTIGRVTGGRVMLATKILYVARRTTARSV